MNMNKLNLLKVGSVVITLVGGLCTILGGIVEAKQTEETVRNLTDERFDERMREYEVITDYDDDDEDDDE